LGYNSIPIALNRRADKTCVFRTPVLGDNPTIALMDGFHVEDICSEPELLRFSLGLLGELGEEADSAICDTTEPTYVFFTTLVRGQEVEGSNPFARPL